MSDTAAAQVSTSNLPATKKTKATKPKGEKKARVAPSHPVYGVMIKSAIKELKDRRGASKQAILKYIVQKYKVGDNEKQINARLRIALKRGVQTGILMQATGTGAAGRFRLAEKSGHEATTAPKVTKKPMAKTKAKPKESVAKSADKEVKKEKSSISPKKAAKPKAKSAKSPQKVAVKKAAPKAKSTKKPKKASPTKT